MKKYLLTMLFALVSLTSTSVFAEQQTIKLSVPGMTCASCPYMVKKAINGVDGIESVTATMEDRTATVTFDNKVTTIEAITKATGDIGYKSSLIN